MSEPGDQLSDKQELAIPALLAEPTIVAAAALIGVDARTMRRWLAEPQFAAAYRAARREVVEQSLARIQAATGQATTRLVRLLKSADSSVALRAARTILDLSVKGIEMADVLERLEALEANLGAR